MAKLSLSSVLEARKRIRITTILATLLVVVLLFQGLVFNNPKSTKAAKNAVEVEGDKCETIKLNSGSYMIDEQNRLWGISNNTYLLDLYNGNVRCGKYKWEDGKWNTHWNTWGAIYVDSRNITVGDNDSTTEQATLTFTGSSSAVNLKSFTIKSDGVVSHIGPGSTSNTVDKPAVERFGVVLTGYFYPKYDPSDCDKQWAYTENQIKTRDLMVKTNNLNDDLISDNRNPISAPRYSYKHYDKYDEDKDYYKIRLKHLNIMYVQPVGEQQEGEIQKIDGNTVYIYHNQAGASSFQDGDWGDFMGFSAYIVNDGNSNFFINFLIKETAGAGNETRYCKIPVTNFYSESQIDTGNGNNTDIVGDGFRTPVGYQYPPENDESNGISDVKYITNEEGKLVKYGLDGWSDGKTMGEDSIGIPDYRSRVEYRHYTPRKIESKYNSPSFDDIDPKYQGKVNAVFYHDPSFIKDTENYTVQNGDYTPMKDDFTDWEDVYKPLFSPDRRSSPITTLDLSSVSTNDKTIDAYYSYLTSKPAQKAARISWTGALPDTAWQDPGIPGQREVNLNIAEDLTIESGGKIDVSGKGFRGGGSQEATEGINGAPPSPGKDNANDGTNKGGGLAATDGTGGGGGGGHGGHGGSGIKLDTTVSGVGGSAYDNYFMPILGGAGGGGGGSENTTSCYGGPGGGVVIINARNIYIKGENAILADGKNPSGDSSCGAGAGGAIQLKINGELNIDLVLKNKIIFSAEGGEANNIVDGSNLKGGDGGGGRISIQAQLFAGLTEQELSGSANSILDSAIYSQYLNVLPPRLFVPMTDVSSIYAPIISERGTIYVNGGVLNNVKKWLEPISRGGVPVDTTKPETVFNPYAVRTGDVIRVNIMVSNLITGVQTTIKDEILKTNSNPIKKCDPLAGTYSDKPAEIFLSDVVTWNYTPTDLDKNNTKLFYYWCEIK